MIPVYGLEPAIWPSRISFVDTSGLMMVFEDWDTKESNGGKLRTAWCYSMAEGNAVMRDVIKSIYLAL